MADRKRGPEDLPQSIVKTLRNGAEVTRRDIGKRLARRRLEGETSEQFAQQLEDALELLVRREIVKRTRTGGGGKGQPSHVYKLIGMYDRVAVNIPDDKPWAQSSEGSVVVAEEVGDSIRLMDLSTKKVYTFKKTDLIALIAGVPATVIEDAEELEKQQRRKRIEKRMRSLMVADPTFTDAEARRRATYEIAEEDGRL